MEQVGFSFVALRPNASARRAVQPSPRAPWSAILTGKASGHGAAT